MTSEEKALAAFDNWYSGLPKLYGGRIPAKGSLGGGLVVLNKLKEKYDLSIESHTAKGGSQVSGLSGPAVRAILAAFGETRPFLEEGGRTNRGARGAVKDLLMALSTCELGKLPRSKRNEVLTGFQWFMVDQVREYHELKRLEISYDPASSTWQSISDLLDKAKEAGKEGPVAQYLVGAKLQLRFPELEISNESFSTADVQLGRSGDFLVGNTVFHVTVAPAPALYEKCRRNLKAGASVYLLVRFKDLVGTKQVAENTAPGQIMVESIETFVSQNLDEIAAFSQTQRISEFRSLLETYNHRVDAADTNKSLMVEIPPNIR